MVVSERTVLTIPSTMTAVLILTIVSTLMKNEQKKIFTGTVSTDIATFYDKEKECELANTFEEVEELYYSIHYKDFIEGQNERNVKNRHPERNRTTSDILKHKKTCPEETIYQIGTLDNHISPDILLQIVTDFMIEITERFGTHVHI